MKQQATYFNIDINNKKKCFLSSKSAMISEGSYDTEDWSIYAEHSALDHWNKL